MKKFITDSNEIPRAVDVIVIGGGPAGTGTLWALHRAAPHLKTLLIEQSDKLGAGSSTASLENYRTCWPAACLAAMMRRSVEIYHQADAYLGDGAAETIHLKERGYLFCAFTDAQADTLQKDVEHLHAMGMTHIEFLNAQEVAYRYGWLGEKVIAAKFDPIAGWLDSNALIYRYAQCAESAQILLNTPNTEILVEAGKVVGVKTPHGTIFAPVVLIANGANAASTGRTAGVDLPIVVRPRQSFTTGWRHPEFPEHAPMLIGAAPFPHVRPEAKEGAIFGWEYGWVNKNASPPFDSLPNTLGRGRVGYVPNDYLIDPIYPAAPLKDPRFPSITLALLARQFGHAAGQGFANGRYLQGLRHNIGYYVYRSEEVANRAGVPYTSERAILDAVPSVEGLFVSIAHVGHGIMTSAAAGEIIAAKILNQPPQVPNFGDFGWDVAWVEYDENAL